MNRPGKIGLMLCSFAICGTASIVHRSLEVRRERAKPAELYEVVWKQINAFRCADYSEAYQQVSSTFQEHFNIDAFSDLVRTDYPDLLRADRVEFGNVHFAAGHAIVHVYFILPEGEIVPCIYSLIPEDQVWKIDYARVQKRWPTGRRLGGMRS